MKSYILKLFLVVLTALASNAHSERVKYTDFSIHLPDDWYSTEMEDNPDDSKAWVFGNYGTEDEPGYLVSVLIIDLKKQPEYSSDFDLSMAKDRWINVNLHSLGKTRAELETIDIFDDEIDVEHVRATRFQTVFMDPEIMGLAHEIFGGLYLTIIDNKVFSVHYQALKQFEFDAKPKLENIIKTIEFSIIDQEKS